MRFSLEAYNAEHWREFFSMMGHGAAVLAGLVFVAIELNHKALFKDATHHARALGTISGFMAAFAVSCFALLDAITHVWFGLLWAITTTVALTIYLKGLSNNQNKVFQSNIGVTRARLVVGISLYLAQIIGALLMVGGNKAGIYIATVALTLNMLYLVSGAWLLFIAVGILEKKGKV